LSDGMLLELMLYGGTMVVLCTMVAMSEWSVVHTLFAHDLLCPVSVDIASAVCT